MIYGAKMLDKCVKSQIKNFCTLSFFAKSSLVKLKQTKSKNGQYFSSTIFHGKQLWFGSAKIP